MEIEKKTKHYLTVEKNGQPNVSWFTNTYCCEIEGAFTKSLASERSRDITFAALQTFITQTLTLTNTPNHTIIRFSNPNPTE